MARHTIELMNGESIELETSLSLGDISRFKKKNLMSKGMFKAVINGAQGLEDEVIEYGLEAYYLAYLKANENPTLSKEDLLDQINYTLMDVLKIYGEVAGGNKQKPKMAKNFEAVTKVETGEKK